MYKLIYYVPTEHKEKTKNALFQVGAGRYKNYECCSFETLGTGQFKPINEAKPFLGEIDTIETVQEYRVEMICEEDLIRNVIEVLKEVHPYEEVAFDVITLEQHFK